MERFSSLQPVAGAHLWYEAMGPATGHPVLVVHGGPGADSRYLRPQMDRLVDFVSCDPHNQQNPIRLFYFDQRGAERSPLDAGTSPGSSLTHVHDVEQMRLVTGVEKITVVGYSWGALLTLLYALHFPHRIEQLVLISPAPVWAAARQLFQENLQKATQRPEVATLKQEWLAQEETLDAETKRRRRFALAVAGYFVDPRKALDMTPFRVQKRVEEAVWSSLVNYDLRADLPVLKGCPTLVIHGKQDVIPIETAHTLATLVQGQFVALDDCGHVPFIEGNEIFWQAIQNFLATQKPQ